MKLLLVKAKMYLVLMKVCYEIHNLDIVHVQQILNPNSSEYVNVGTCLQGD
jgi:hypothetical protein